MPENTVTWDLDDFNIFKEKAPSKLKEEYMKGVVEYSLNGEYLNCYDSIEAAGKTLKISSKVIGNICYGRYYYSLKHERIFLFRGDDIAKRLPIVEERLKRTLKPVNEYSLGGKLLYAWPTTTKAAEFYGIPCERIKSCCIGKKLFIKDKIFAYPNEDIKPRVKKIKQKLYALKNKKPKCRPVDVYTLDGSFIESFPSASAAARKYNVNVSTITRCCYNKGAHSRQSLTAKNKIFLFVGDSITDRLELIEQFKNKIKYE